MDLEEVLSIKGSKILDSSIFNSGYDILGELYGCKSFLDIPFNELLIEIDSFREVLPYIHNRDLFTIPEVTKENEIFLEKINQVISYHNKKPDLFHNNKNKSFKQGDSYSKENSKEKIMDSLNVLGKEINKLIKGFKSRDITTNFSYEEKKEYNKFTNYFSYICDKEPLKIDSSSKIKYKNKVPCDFKTDEKIVSAAFTLALTNPVNILSSDMDLKRMIYFFCKDKFYKNRFNLPWINNKVSLYSKFKGNYELKGNWFDKTS